MENVTLLQIHKDLAVMRKELDSIRDYMKDLDTLTTYDDFKALEAYKKEKAEGTLTSHAALKKELGL